MKRNLLVMLIVALILGACSGREMETHEPWARAALQGENSVVYMIVHNHTNTDDVLLGASTDVAQAVEIHETVMSDDGVMRMIPQASIPLAAGDELEFEPGGLHIMLVNVNRDLNMGDQIILTLHFENYADITLNVPVSDAAHMDDSHDMPQGTFLRPISFNTYKEKT